MTGRSKIPTSSLQFHHIHPSTFIHHHGSQEAHSGLIKASRGSDVRSFSRKHHLPRALRTTSTRHPSKRFGYIVLWDRPIRKSLHVSSTNMVVSSR